MNFKDLKNYLNKILVFYLPDKAGYWNSITPCSIKEKPETLGSYYLNFISKINFPGQFSEEGVPLFTYKNNSNIEHPTVIAQYAFGLYELLCQKQFSDEQLKNKFIKIADWFVKNKTDLKGGAGWYIYIDYNPEYNLPNPWISAMVQGEALSVLTRAAKLTGEVNYELAACSALGPFNYDVKEGGLVNYFNDIPVYEECPTPRKPMVVLNGFIFSLFGLYDLYLLNRNSEAEKLFTNGVSSLKKLLPYFEIKKWTNYYLFDFPQNYYSSYTYHILVTEQLRAIYYLTGEKIFLEYHNRWKEFSASIINKTIILYNKLTSSNKFYN